MFFGNYTKLKDELKMKNEQIDTMQIVIEELNKEAKEQLYTHKKDVRIINQDIENLTKKLKMSDSELKLKLQRIETLNEQVETMTNEDSLTGVYNKRYFYDISENIISLSKREKKNLSVAVIYIDKYYEIKLSHGKVAANDLIQLFIHKISNSIRESDVFVRFDEDEFVILFPNTTLDQATTVSEKIETSVNKAPMVGSSKLKVNIGVSEFMYSQENINITLDRAKKALLTNTNKIIEHIAKSA